MEIKYGIGELVVLTNRENTQYLLVKVGWITAPGLLGSDDGIKYHSVVKKASKEFCAGIIHSNIDFSDKPPWRPIPVDKDSIEWAYSGIDNPDVVD